MPQPSARAPRGRETSSSIEYCREALMKNMIFWAGPWRRKEGKPQAKCKGENTANIFYKILSWVSWQRTGEQTRVEGERQIPQRTVGDTCLVISRPPSLGLIFQFPKHAGSKVFLEPSSISRMCSFLLFLPSHVPLLLSGWQQIERLMGHNKAGACPLPNHS